MDKKLYLFDIDGTLISPGPTARKAINQAIENYTGITPDLQIEDVAGLTDQLIVKNALVKYDNNGDLTQIIENIVAEYLTLFEHNYAASTEAFVYEDSLTLLNKIIGSKQPLGLLTGNAMRGAQIKLERFDLMKHFPFGVFAEDGESRTDLPIVARERAKKTFGQEFKFEDITLIGDTKEDAIAAKSNGCKSIIVCRRKEWYDGIVNAGADLIVERLDDPAIII